jgi:hypothetical protein
VTAARDRQRTKVYTWEEGFVAPRDPSSIAFAQAQGMVDTIWAEMGLRFPPKVEPLPRQARSTVADANRLTIRLADVSPSWWLLHELGHAMTSTYDGQSDGHGPKFMGLYAQLLTRYLRVPTDALLKSLHAAGIAIDINAEPVFVDDPPSARASAGPPRTMRQTVTRRCLHDLHRTKQTVIAKSPAARCCRC